MATSTVRNRDNSCKKLIVPHNAMVADLSFPHGLLAHVNLNGIRKLASENIVDRLQMHFTGAANYTCESRMYAKQTRDPIPKRVEARSMHMLDFMHSSVGTMPVTLLGRSKYFVKLIDDHSRYC